jgi:ABC-type sulfate transport system permease component
LLAEIGFQIFRLAILPDYTFEQMIYYASRGVIVMAVICLVISAIVALLIRKKDKVAK